MLPPPKRGQQFGRRGALFGVGESRENLLGSGNPPNAVDQLRHSAVFRIGNERRARVLDPSCVVEPVQGHVLDRNHLRDHVEGLCLRGLVRLERLSRPDVLVGSRRPPSSGTSELKFRAPPRRSGWPCSLRGALYFASGPAADAVTAISTTRAGQDTFLISGFSVSYALSIRSLMPRARWPRTSASRVVLVGPYSLLAGAGFMTRPIASTSCDQPVPLTRQLRFSRGRQAVVLRLLIRLAHAPLPLQPAALHETVQRRIEGAGFDLEQLVGLRADGLADAVAVVRTPLQDSKDEHVERALEKFQAPFVGVFAIVVDSRRR